jgi:cytochrome c2
MSQERGVESNDGQARFDDGRIVRRLDSVLAGNRRGGKCSNFQLTNACHLLESDRNMIGRSLANLWGRRARGLTSFPRYSTALQSSGIAWNEVHG